MSLIGGLSYIKAPAVSHLSSLVWSVQLAASGSKHPSIYKTIFLLTCCITQRKSTATSFILRIFYIFSTSSSGTLNGRPLEILVPLYMYSKLNYCRTSNGRPLLFELALTGRLLGWKFRVEYLPDLAEHLHLHQRQLLQHHLRLKRSHTTNQLSPRIVQFPCAR